MQMKMTLYIDGDAFPNRLKAIVFRAIERFSLPTVVVSNKRIDIGRSDHITYIIVGAGAADGSKLPACTNRA